VLASCDAPMPDNSAQASQEPTQPKVPISIRTVAGGPKQQAFLVTPSRDVPFEQLAAAVRETGYRCVRVTAFNQLEQNGKVLEVYKIDCGKRSYQVTIFNGNTHIKPWTGNILGR
jgi:hypothetical protein